jgi:hypothetical protein
MIDLDTILNILCTYYHQRELNHADMEILFDWLTESQANENLLTELSDDAPWTKDSSSVGIHELIRVRLKLLYLK